MVSFLKNQLQTSVWTLYKIVQIEISFILTNLSTPVENFRVLYNCNFLIYKPKIVRRFSKWSQC